MTGTHRGPIPFADMDAVFSKVYGSNLSSTHKITRSSTFVVAASDSFAKSVEQADYVCDGTADNVEIQAAIDELPSSGGKIKLLEGNYTINTHVDIAGNDITLSGVGNGTKLKMADNTGESDYGIFQFSTANNLLISDMYFNGNKENQGTYILTPHLVGGSVSNAVVKNCFFNNSMGDGLELGGEGSTNVWVVGNNIQNSSENSIHINGIINGYVCNNLLKYDAKASLVLAHGGGSQIVISGNQIIDPGYTCIALNDDCAYKDDIIISNNILVDGGSTTGGIYVGTDFTQVEITANSIRNCGAPTASPAVLFSTGSRVNFTSNSLINGRKGIVINSDYCIVSENSLYNMLSDGITVNGDRNKITNNSVRDVGGYNSSNPIVLNGNYNYIYGNYIKQHEVSSACGVLEAEGVDFNIIAQNDLRDGTFTIVPIIVTGANSILRYNPGYATENTGSTTLLANTTSITVPHGLAATPTNVTVTPKGNIGSCWWDTPTSTTFIIHCSTAPAADVDVNWTAIV